MIMLYLFGSFEIVVAAVKLKRTSSAYVYSVSFKRAKTASRINLGNFLFRVDL